MKASRSRPAGGTCRRSARCFATALGPKICTGAVLCDIRQPQFLESSMPAMIVASQPLAVEAGARVLARGGNAYDAALACAWVQFVVDPHSCGVGGYLLLTHHRPSE